MVSEVVFVLGASGSGKGTQCSLISKEYGFVHLSAGDLLREERQRPGSEFGDLIEDRIRNGQIVPSEVTSSLLDKAMMKSEKTRFLIDGFPRSCDNAATWDRIMSVKTILLFILFLNASEEVCTQRILGRAVGSGRSDDDLASLKKRFDTYLNETLPVVQHYEERGLVRNSNAEASRGKVFDDIKKVFNASGLDRNS